MTTSPIPEPVPTATRVMDGRTHGASGHPLSPAELLERALFDDEARAQILAAAPAAPVL